MINMVMNLQKNDGSNKKLENFKRDMESLKKSKWKT